MSCRPKRSGQTPGRGGTLFAKRLSKLLPALIFCWLNSGCGQATPTVLRLDGQAADGRYFAVTGSGGLQFVNRSNNGWTICVPETASNEPVGLTAKAIVHGDFRLQAAYEIESELSISQTGSGPSMYIATDTDSKNAAQISRLNRSKEGAVISSAFLFSDEKGRRRHDISFTPNESAKGWMRLERRGALLTYSSKTPDSDWTELRQTEFGRHPITTMRIGLERGSPLTPCTIHWTDISLELDGLPLSWWPAWQRRTLFVATTLTLPALLMIWWLIVDITLARRRTENRHEPTSNAAFG